MILKKISRQQALRIRKKNPMRTEAAKHAVSQEQMTPQL